MKLLSISLPDAEADAIARGAKVSVKADSAGSGTVQMKHDVPDPLDASTVMTRAEFSKHAHGVPPTSGSVAIPPNITNPPA